MQAQSTSSFTKEVANALFGYFEELYYLNINVIKLCGVNVFDNENNYERCTLDVIQAIPRLIPYIKEKRTDQLKIVNGDGLIEFSEAIPFIEGAYYTILNNNYSFLSDVKDIRNKLEHKMHAARLVSSGHDENRLAFDMGYLTQKDGKKEIITISADELLKLIKEINDLFDRIQELVKEYAQKNNKMNYPYYRRILRYRFADFNKIYNSNLLMQFGKMLYPF